MSLIRVNEGSKGVFRRRYSLAISTVISQDNPIEQEIRHINEAMLNWVRKRRDRCEMLCLVFEAIPAEHDSILQSVLRLVEQDVDVKSLLRSLSVRAVLLNPETEATREFVFSFEAQEDQSERLQATEYRR